MIDIRLAAVANQALTINLENRLYAITVKEINGTMAATITRDEELVVSNQRITPGTPVLPYRYQEEGNFIFVSDNETLPDFEQFGVNQFLMYVTIDELAAYRAE